MKPPRTLGLATSFAAVQRHLEQVSRTLSSISFGTTTSNTDPDQNLAVFKATGTSPVAPNTEFSVSHNLPHVPIGFMILNTSKAGHLYKSTSAWTAATSSTLGKIFLKADIDSLGFTIAIL